MRNVLSWRGAIDSGHQPKDYPYVADLVPVGKYEAMLDFKIWSKKVNGIDCYFTRPSTGMRFRLTVFRNEEGAYFLPDCPLDFSECADKTCYVITVSVNSKGNAAFKGMEALL